MYHKTEHLILHPQASPAVGQKVYVTPMNQIRGSKYPFKYVPDDIQNSMFKPLIRKEEGADVKTSL